MSSRRHPCRAGSFYPSEPAEVRAFFREWRATESGGVEDHAEAPIGGIVPHAGWIYSGAVAFRLFEDLHRGQPHPERIVLLGAVHVFGVPRPGLGVFEVWETPIGPLDVDTEFEERLLDAGVVERNRRAHAGEHSIEVQLPIVRELWPQVRIVPIATPSHPQALALGQTLAQLAGSGGETLVVASTDLTHYGVDNYGFAPVGGGDAGERFAWTNDERFLELVEHLDADAVIPEAAANRNACGSGAVAAALAFAKGVGGVRCEVLEHTNSLLVGLAHGFGHAADFVGYAAAAFRRS